ncbi:hypothetical protein OL548_14110 [Lysinibacillus sp. MHQ-1]|nr:hypothetical protein OL548_14110 [Lysinibacillus sp. MHQ-1]
MLTIGEIADASAVAQEVNGYQAELEDMVEEIKKLIDDGDGEANIMHWWVHKMRRLPSEYVSLSLADKACIIASLRIKIEEDKKQEREAKRGSKKR